MDNVSVVMTISKSIRTESANSAMSLAAPNAKLVNLLVAPLALIKMEQTSPQTELVSVFKKATS